ncbi:MAG: glycosyltransferase [Minisyncoccia bacterium]|jgi:glycosyltransferase involved in cell wall biosynthesis
MAEIVGKKKVLFIITQSEPGGAQRFLVNFISNLDKDKYELALITGKNENNGLSTSLKEKNIKFIVAESLHREINFAEDIEALREIKKEIGAFKPDTLFLASSKAGFIGSLAAKQIGFTGKVIYRIGGWTFNDPWPSWKKFVFRMMEKQSAHWKDIIILNNQKDYQQVEKFGIKPRGLIIVVPNGLDVYKMDFLLKEEARLKLYQKISGKSGGIFQAKIIIGTIANFYPTKGLEYLVETAEFFKNDPDMAFVIIGDGPERENLKFKIKNLKLENKVFLVGQISDAYRYLPAFDIFVLPSVKEGFPWALIEAMAAKLPVITTDVGAVSEIIESGKNGIIVPAGKPEFMANAIKTVLDGSKSAQELGIQAHQSVLHKYRLGKMVSQIEDLL